MKRFYDNKIIWITGASSGIGRALVTALSQFNTILVISSRREAELLKIKEAYKGLPAKIEVLAFDLMLLNNFETHTKSIINQFGRIDILINNGGISQRSLAVETPLEIDRKIMEVNYFSNIQLAKCVLPYMLSQKSGHIAVTSSISGKFGFYLRSGYSASKHALHGFYESLYLENNLYGVNVTLICPGSIKTNISQNAINKEGKSLGYKEERLENGMEPINCAQMIIKAIANNKREIVIGGSEIIPVYLKRFFPSLFWSIIKRIKP